MFFVTSYNDPVPTGLGSLNDCGCESKAVLFPAGGQIPQWMIYGAIALGVYMIMNHKQGR